MRHPSVPRICKLLSTIHLGCGWIAVLLTSMLKTSGNTEPTTQSEKYVIGVSNDNRAGCDKNKVDGNELVHAEVDGSEIEDDEFGNKVQKTSKSKNLSKSKKTVGSLDLFTPRAKLVFTKLRQTFFKAPIIHHFDLEYHIQIEIDVSDHTIDRVFS